MLTLAAFILEKLGGDSMDDVQANLSTYRERIAAAPPAPVAGGRRSPGSADRHGLTGTDEAGSGGDD
jgi:hypothetical protein